VEAGSEAVVITIADDGRGIDRRALQAKWERNGGNPREASAMTLEDLVFADGLSSRDAASDISGRGVGMAAVKAELVRVGGSVGLTSRPGLGTELIFRLPYAKS
jgi:two-component system chemotaxis sensor kinase CheA